MNEYAVMPLNDYVNTCDMIRQKTKGTSAIKSGDLPEKVGDVFNAGVDKGWEDAYGQGYEEGWEDGEAQGYVNGKEDGKIELLDESKYMHPTISGKIVSAKDVSTLDQNVDVKLTSDTITDFSGIKVKQIGKNLLRFPYQESNLTTDTFTIVTNDDGTILVNGSKSGTWSYYLGTGAPYKPELKAGVTYIVSGIDKSTQGNIIMTVKDTLANKNVYFSLNQPSGFKWEEHYQFTNMYILFNNGVVLDNCVIKPQLEIGTVPTEYEPPTHDNNIITATANADGTVNGLPLRSPNVTFSTDNGDVTINYQYYRDIDTCIDNLIAGVVLSGGD